MRRAAPSSSSQDIVITGTRIPQPNLTSASPVTVLSSQDVKLQGTTRTEDLINSLPQVVRRAGFERLERRDRYRDGQPSRSRFEPHPGADQRPPSAAGRPDAAATVADINFIPSALIKRVDVLTGGASSVYGADAVAGVVNFIMDTNFAASASTARLTSCTTTALAQSIIERERSSTASSRRTASSTNGGAQDISAAFGAGFDDNRGSIWLMRPIASRMRCSRRAATIRSAHLGANPAYMPAGQSWYCGGSSTSAEGRIRLFTTRTGTTRLFNVST